VPTNKEALNQEVSKQEWSSINMADSTYKEMYREIYWNCTTQALQEEEPEMLRAWKS
jgi:hypothetical protein